MTDGAATATSPGVAGGGKGSDGPLSRRRWTAGLIAHEAGVRFALVGVWILMVVLYSLLLPGLFFEKNTATAIFSSQQVLIFLTAALLCTMIVGEFVDLSVASVFGLSATLVPVLTVLHGWNVWVAAGAAVLAAICIGIANATLIIFLGVNTIVVTLGMGTLLLGISLWLTDSNSVSGLSEGFAKINLLEIGGLPVSFYYGLALMLLFAYILLCTPLGRHMRVVGASHEVSRLAGIRVNRIRFGAFVMAALIAGVGGVIATAGLGGFNPSASQSYLLPTFAAVFLGAAAVEPGRFNPLGTVIAIYFLATGILGLQMLGAAGWVSDVFYGGVVVLAVAISTVVQRVLAGR